MIKRTEDLRIVEINEVSAPEVIHAELPITDTAAATVNETRRDIHQILTGKDDRLIVVVGPCSIHDVGAALEYAEKLKPLKTELKEQLLIVMRVYFEKPRTTVGWKGLINDPKLDDSFQINTGLRLARELLLNINQLGIPAGTEFLDLVTPQYIADLVGWGAIGARTTESQVHRELASGLSCPVGFKNGTDGTLSIAIDAVRAASRPHCFLSLTLSGRSAIFKTEGNSDCHIILRGGKTPNYQAEHVAAASAALSEAQLLPQIMIDCSHANSAKQYERQIDVTEDIAAQIAAGDKAIMGAMIESHLLPGRQDNIPGKALTYGQSITDACLGWQDSEKLLRLLADAVDRRRSGN
ncbi:MAG: 3-deoxy-7-phosphoheptulonate synthase AroG [Thiohalomonadales bacterium]